MYCARQIDTVGAKFLAPSLMQHEPRMLYLLIPFISLTPIESISSPKTWHSILRHIHTDEYDN